MESTATLQHRNRFGLWALALALLAIGGAPAHASTSDIIARHTVEEGQYLSRLAVLYYGNADEWRVIFEANPELDSPDRVDVGSELRIPAIASEDERAVEDGDTITLVTSNAYHPFADSALAHQGMAPRIARAVFEAAGYAPEVKVLDSWSAVERETRDMKHDVALPYVETDERRSGFAFSAPIYPMQSQIFVSADHGGIPPDWRDRDLVGTSACKPTGYFISDIRPYIDNGYVHLQWGDSVADCLRRLAAGDVDFVPVNRYTGWATIHGSDDLEPDRFNHLARPLALAPLRIMVSRDHPNREEIIDDFNEALGVLRDGGQINELRSQALADFTSRLPDTATATLERVDDADLERREEPGPGPTIYTANHYQPFADQGLPFGGMSAEVVRWAVHEGFDNPPFIDIRPSWPSVEEGVLAGDADGAFPYVQTQEREDRGFIFSEPLHEMQVEVFVRADDALETFTGMADLSGRTVCKPAGYYTSDVRQPIGSGLIELLEPRPDTAAGCMEALVAGDADFVSMNPFVAAGAIDRAAVEDDAVRSAGPMTRVQLHVMAADTEDGRAFIRQLDRQLNAMAERGSLEEIEERHQRLFQQ